MSKKYSFKEWCVNNHRLDLLEIWDYELNVFSPNEIIKADETEIYLKCPRNLHESKIYLSKKITKNTKACCAACNSIGQYIIDTDGEDYLLKIWSDKNTKSPFKISKLSQNERIWLRCLSDEKHEDYNLTAKNYLKNHNCPICSSRMRYFNRKITETNNLGTLYPNVLCVWSDKNEKSPFEYTHGTDKIVWWKCENGIHDDYQRRVDNSVMYDFRCPICGKENQKHPNGNEHPNWKGGITPSHKTERKTKEYNEWRSSVYERDKYLCQICLDPSHNKLRAHHIFSFKSYPNKRYDIYNGITLCEECHDTTYYGSFHQVYRTHNNTPDQFNEFANRKRKELGITTPFNIYDYMGDLQNPTKESIDFTEEWSDDSAITDTSSQSVA